VRCQPSSTDERRTIYWFLCEDAGPDNLDCEDPSDEGPTWYYTCGDSPAACAKQWFPVVAAKNAKNVGYSWSVITIPRPWSPVRADKGVKDGLKVWAYKGRPVFTYYLDKRPGDIEGWGMDLHFFTSFAPVGQLGYMVNFIR
jgi:hypothetical protein